MADHHQDAQRAGVAARVACLSPPLEGAPQAEGDGEGRGRDQGTTDSRDCAGHLGGAQLDADEGKRFATLRARLALAGWTLSRTAADDGQVAYCAGRWGRVRVLDSLDDVARLADLVGAPA